MNIFLAGAQELAAQRLLRIKNAIALVLAANQIQERRADGWETSEKALPMIQIWADCTLTIGF